jgi:hypothetical protein
MVVAEGVFVVSIAAAVRLLISFLLCLAMTVYAR